MSEPDIESARLPSKSISVVKIEACWETGTNLLHLALRTAIPLQTSKTSKTQSREDSQDVGSDRSSETSQKQRVEQHEQDFTRQTIRSGKQPQERQDGSAGSSTADLADQEDLAERDDLADYDQSIDSLDGWKDVKPKHVSVLTKGSVRRVACYGSARGLTKGGVRRVACYGSVRGGKRKPLHLSINEALSANKSGEYMALCRYVKDLADLNASPVHGQLRGGSSDSSRPPSTPRPAKVQPRPLGALVHLEDLHKAGDMDSSHIEDIHGK